MESTSVTDEPAASARLRIVVVLKTNTGGLWTVPQVEALRARGHDVRIVLPPGQGRLTAELAARGFQVLPSPFDFRFRPTPGVLRALWRLRRLLRDLRPDVVHYHLYASAMATRLAAAGLGVRKVHMVAGPLFLESPIIRRVERLLWRTDDLVVCGTEFTSRLYGRLGCPPGRRPVVTYGVDTERFSVDHLLRERGQPTHRPAHTELRRKVRAELGVAEDVLLVVMVAFVYPPRHLVHRGRGIKGHDILLTAWDRFHARHPRSHLLLVGGGWNQAGRAHRAELIRRFRVAERADVTWTDSVTEVREVYAAADLSVSPSLSEGHGAVVEASAMGVPSIVSDAGGLPETVDEYAGWVVPADDATALESALDTAGQEFLAGRLAARGTNARRRAVALFDSTAAATRLAAIIERSVAAAPAPRVRSAVPR
ncbi:glycosyltransferase family 4 protein [Plantactinospora veratri]|uniref:Glycosyltransferase family 4 protein n=1 Tax=Plantactinospora veratri TaxID=1436122 RepID=A0ABU7SFC9_9ACTN